MQTANRRKHKGVGLLIPDAWFTWVFTAILCISAFFWGRLYEFWSIKKRFDKTGSIYRKRSKFFELDG